jgi:hypothetical protein
MNNKRRMNMSQVISKDGTAIVYDQFGQGPAVIVVGGTLDDRSQQAPLAALLSEHFTVFNYDRRGRGESGDTPPYAVELEIEDLDALLNEAGGSAFVYGTSGCVAPSLVSLTTSTRRPLLPCWLSSSKAKTTDLREPRRLH